MECPSHLTLQFSFEELAVERGSNQQPYIRILIFFNKKKGLSEAFFHEHWKSIHADLTMSFGNGTKNFSRYVQFHQDAEHRKLVSSLSQYNMQPLQYDGCAEFHAENAEQFLRFMADIHNSKELVGCGSRFTDVDDGMHVMVGYDNLIYGSHITTSGGCDGILPSDPRIEERLRLR
ncbi:hypothetical protein PMIN04_012799 [Paraphaeosphaeria minitans]|uniref:EthD domain-containing protein n=1 Tax=Paraphaeosphaeria minitans TaxID=565426 RepID=A0A9P6KL20_9PLEO|nr:hypothetical protein PMIN01_11962 [Paraphaeosphaeria minitans]